MALFGILRVISFRMQKGDITAADYKAAMISTQNSLQEGAIRVRFTRSHDTSWFPYVNFVGYTPLQLNVDAIHSWFGVPMVFAGDKEAKDTATPDDDPGTWEHYRKIFAVRKQLPEFAKGKILLESVQCDDPDVFTGMASHEDNASLAASLFPC